MRLLSYEGVEHKLSERNWKKLLNRFDASRASLNAFGYFSLRVGSICENRSYKCIRCPLRDPHKKINSCTYVFSKIIGDELFPYVNLFDTTVIWDPKHDSEVRQALQKVRDVLTTAKKI